MFQTADLSTRSCTRSISYELDFLVILPAEIPEASEIAQRFKVEVVLDQDLIEDDEYDAPIFMRGMFIGRNIEFSIEFSDYAVSQTLYATIDEWVRSLPHRKIGALRSMIYKSERSVRTYLDSFCRIFVYFTGAAAAARSNEIGDKIVIVILTLGLSSLFFTLSNVFIDRFYKAVGSSKRTTMLCLTVGDIERAREVQNREKRKHAFATFMLLGIILTTALSIFSNYLYDLMKIYFNS